MARVSKTRRAALFGLLGLLVIVWGSLQLWHRGTTTNADMLEEFVSSGDDEFAPIRVVPPFPPITKIPVVKADQAGDKVSDEELVLGVVVNGKARAYPINVLTGPRREILNDQLGGRAIAATW